MDRPSTRAGGQDERVYRCTCGAWAYTGITCSTCNTTRENDHELDRRSEQDLP